MVYWPSAGTFRCQVKASVVLPAAAIGWVRYVGPPQAGCNGGVPGCGSGWAGAAGQVPVAQALPLLPPVAVAAASPESAISVKEPVGTPLSVTCWSFPPGK